jgi:hypothetical protein
MKEKAPEPRGDYYEAWEEGYSAALHENASDIRLGQTVGTVLSQSAQGDAFLAEIKERVAATPFDKKLSAGYWMGREVVARGKVEQLEKKLEAVKQFALKYRDKNYLKKPDDASDDYWEGATDAQSGISAMIYNMLEDE